AGYARERPPIVQEEAVHAPVHVVCVGVLAHYQIPAPRIPAAVSVVEHRRGDLGEIDGVAADDVGLTRAARDLDRRDLLLAAPQKLAAQRVDRRVRRQTERDRATPEVRDEVRERRVTGIVPDLPEPDRSQLALEGEPAESADLEIPIDL